MSPGKPITPPEKFVAFNGVVYEIIPGSEDIPDTETTFGGPHYTRNGLGRWASPKWTLHHLHPRPRLHHRRGSRGRELPFYCSFDVSLVKSQAATVYSTFHS